jgi:hypothetical protein
MIVAVCYAVLFQSSGVLVLRALFEQNIIQQVTVAASVLMALSLLLLVVIFFLCCIRPPRHCLECRIPVVARRYKVDPQLLAYCWSALFTTPRDVTRLQQLKNKAIQWMRDNQQDWDEITKACTLEGVMLGASELVDVDIAFMEQLSVFANSLHVAHHFATLGAFANGSSLPAR